MVNPDHWNEVHLENQIRLERLSVNGFNFLREGVVIRIILLLTCVMVMEITLEFHWENVNIVNCSEMANFMLVLLAKWIHFFFDVLLERFKIIYDFMGCSGISKYQVIDLVAQINIQFLQIK